MSIADEKYVSFTTYRKDGSAKALPVWICALDDGRVGFTTPSTSWKVKRLANDRRVALQPSDGRGRIKEGSEVVTGTGELVTGDEYRDVAARIAAKYGFTGKIMRLVGKIGSLFGRSTEPDSAIVIALDEA